MTRTSRMQERFGTGKGCYIKKWWHELSMVCWNRGFNYLLHRARAVPATMTIAKATPRTVSVQPILLNTKSRPDRKSNQSAEPETHGINPWRAWSDYTYRTKITNGLTIFIRTYIVCTFIRTFKKVSIKIFSWI